MPHADAEAVLQKQVLYDGEDYTRSGLESMVAGYAARHEQSVKTLAELSGEHDAQRKEMTADLVQ
jgi:hypothetical protein